MSFIVYITASNFRSIVFEYFIYFSYLQQHSSTCYDDSTIQVLLLDHVLLWSQFFNRQLDGFWGSHIYDQEQSLYDKKHEESAYQISRSSILMEDISYVFHQLNMVHP